MERFRSMCIKYHKEIDTVKDVISKQFMGIFCLHLNGFKEEALPAPTRLLDLVENVMPW